MGQDLRGSGVLADGGGVADADPVLVPERLRVAAIAKAGRERETRAALMRGPLSCPMTILRVTLLHSKLL